MHAKFIMYMNIPYLTIPDMFTYLSFEKSQIQICHNHVKMKIYKNVKFSTLLVSMKNKSFTNTKKMKNAYKMGKTLECHDLICQQDYKKFSINL